jgi:hypothetical protein
MFLITIGYKHFGFRPDPLKNAVNNVHKGIIDNKRKGNSASN